MLSVGELKEKIEKLKKKMGGTGKQGLLKRAESQNKATMQN